MKKIIFLILFLIFFSLKSQSVFDYTREWGTYFGPTCTRLTSSGINNSNIHYITKNGGIKIDGYTTKIDNYTYPDSYYNQFQTGSSTYNAAYSSNDFYFKMSKTGQLLAMDYTGGAVPSQPSSPYYLKILGQDNQDNEYRLIISANTNIPATSGAWLSANPDAITGSVTLSKYDPAGNLLWTTYLPAVSVSGVYYLLHDDAIYISGTTKVQTGLATPGVMQENYITAYDGNGNLYPNGYIAKLSSSGQRLWMSYLPSGGASMGINEDNLILLVSGSSDLATPGTFQQTQGKFGILNLNATNGQKLWGTNFGITTQNFSISKLKATDDGIFLGGYDNTANNTYFATPGSYKTQVTGNTDMFLTKFDYTGNRVWGTYFGSSGNEISSLATNSFDIGQGRIIIAGVQMYGGENISTTGAFKETQNGSQTDDMFFAMFDTEGNHHWTSYYGGLALSSSYSPANSINVKMVDDDEFYLFGFTTAETGISTSGAYQPGFIQPYSIYPIGFIARFSNKNMAVQETTDSSDLVLYNNPNNGSFRLKGHLLKKENCIAQIYDASGKLIYTQNLPKQELHWFDLQHLLVKGSYVLEICSSNKKTLKTFKFLIH